MIRLKELRENADMHQMDIANLLNIDQSNYSKYELEKVNIPINHLKKLADFYGVSTDYILYRTDQRRPYKPSIIDAKDVELYYSKEKEKDSVDTH